MLKRTVTLPLAALSLLAPSLWASAQAQSTQTTQAGTVVVVTPSAPVVVSGAPGSAAPAPVAAPVQPPGAEEMPPAPPAPQNEDWSNVSHINGHPVPVGERNQYLYKYKQNNIMIDPFGLFFGYYDGSFSHGINQNVALSVGVSDLSVDGDNMLQVTASAPIYFRRTFSGPYLEPGIIFRSTSSTNQVDYANCADCMSSGSSSSDSWAGPELLFGWHWTFDSGLNLAIASGMAKRLDQNNGDSGIEFNGYFRAGYAF